MLNNYQYYRYNNPYNRFNRYNPAFFTQNNYNPSITNIQNNKEEIELNPQDDLDNQNNENFSNNESINTNDNINFQKSNTDKTKFRFGPLDISNDRLSLFGFSIAFDDLLIIGLIFILLLDSDCDYALIIVLGLILFNISFSDLNLFKFI